MKAEEAKMLEAWLVCHFLRLDVEAETRNFKISKLELLFHRPDVKKYYLEFLFHRPEVKKYYLELRSQNQSVLGDFRVQVEAHDKFTSGLKCVSQLIDKAARLRGLMLNVKAPPLRDG